MAVRAEPPHPACRPLLNCNRASALMTQGWQRHGAAFQQWRPQGPRTGRTRTRRLHGKAAHGFTSTPAHLNLSSAANQVFYCTTHRLSGLRHAGRCRFLSRVGRWISCLSSLPPGRAGARCTASQCCQTRRESNLAGFCMPAPMQRVLLPCWIAMLIHAPSLHGFNQLCQHMHQRVRMQPCW